jgi:ubiquinone/menaquinone biosynthesis C-methylase UbiE
MSATNLLFKDNCVDLVISHNVFEHIQGLKKAVSEMIRVLKPGGKLYTYFAPIWSSAFGHHFYEDDGSKVFSIFPEYSHLYFKKEELSKIIFKHIGHFKKERIIAENYIFGNGCNKLFPEDYRNLFNNNGLKIINFVEIDKHYHNEKTTGPLPIKLINLYKNIPPKDFKIVGFEVEGIKE